MSQNELKDEVLKTDVGIDSEDSKELPIDTNRRLTDFVIMSVVGFLIFTVLSCILLYVRYDSLVQQKADYDAYVVSLQEEHDARLAVLDKTVEEYDGRVEEFRHSNTKPSVVFLNSLLDGLGVISPINALVSKIQWTWDGGETYAKRGELVSEYVTDEVLNSGFFNKGIDGSGMYSVDVMGLTAAWDRSRPYIVSVTDDEIEYLSDVYYSIFRSPGSEAYQGSTSDVLSVYHFKYDRRLEKVTSMDVVGQMKVSVRYDQDDIPDNENQTPMYTE